MRVGIIGYGSMGKMLLWKFSENAGIKKKDLLVSNRTKEKLEEARKIARIVENREAAKKADILFICVHPADIRPVLEEVRDVLDPDALLVSLNGSISFDSIHQVVNQRTAKVIPSLTAEIGRSQTLVCYDPQVGEEDKTALSNLLQCFGDVIELPENEMGMGSELVSCMPGFIAAIFDVICGAAKNHTSIPKEQIIRMVLRTMSATGDLMLQKGMAFDEVVTRVATKGGITEVGTRVIYDNFPETAEQLFEKTLEKRRQTSKNAENLG